ncbi:oogenesis-related isoform X2 [Haplochromis burtoni]|uniref:oogenesis-related isoform X2 n=1 Tax=Haplochromis burtoni TaxID=8153 RepID=UPI0003BD1B00|nr:oogenesis-related isoform X2 [Haplochromis burtoni]
MSLEGVSEVVEVEQDQVRVQTNNTEDRVVRRDGVLPSLLRGLFWPFGIVTKENVLVNPTVSSPGRLSLTGRKRLSRVTRLLLYVLPRWMQSALGYPVSSRIGLSLSPEIRVSPAKPCGKGSKRKQDDVDDEDEEDDDVEEQQTWVEALSQELADDDGPEVDPDYEPSSVETESEEYRSHNDTESDLEVSEKDVVIDDVNTGVDVPTPEVSCPAV